MAKAGGNGCTDEDLDVYCNRSKEGLKTLLTEEEFRAGCNLIRCRISVAPCAQRCSVC